MISKIIFFAFFSILSICCTQKKGCNYPLYCDRTNLAFNNGNSFYPSALETSDCTDRKLLKYFIVDGIRYNEDEEYRYIEFTGGPKDIIDTCGYRYATIDFGQRLSFNQTKIWFLKDSLRIDNYQIQCWNGKENNWQILTNFKGIISSKDYSNYSCPYIMVEDKFPRVISSKVRFMIMNCQSYFRMTEFEVYNTQYK